MKCEFGTLSATVLAVPYQAVFALALSGGNGLQGFPSGWCQHLLEDPSTLQCFFSVGRNLAAQSRKIKVNSPPIRLSG